MNEIWQLVSEIAVRLHPDRISLVAEEIAKLSGPAVFGKVRSSFGPGLDTRLIDALKNAWRTSGSLPPEALAAAFRGASATASLIGEREKMELVWTGPATGMVAPRHTEQALLEVISSARRRLFFVSFVAYAVESVNAELRDAADRNVQIDILLEASEEDGGKIRHHDSVGAMKKLLPSATIYEWIPETDHQDYKAVHAKCAVADAKVAFITSANLSTAALERNIEVGVLVKGGSLPRALHHQLDALVTTKIIRAI